jgi:hypothetical protein
MNTKPTAIQFSIDMAAQVFCQTAMHFPSRIAAWAHQAAFA